MSSLPVALGRSASLQLLLLLLPALLLQLPAPPLQLLAGMAGTGPKWASLRVCHHHRTVSKLKKPPDKNVRGQ